MDKYSIVNNKIPDGYPYKCSRKVLNEAVKDFLGEFIRRTTKDDKDAFNRVWRDRIVTFIQLGQSELQRRNNNIVLIVSVITLIIAIIALFKSSGLCDIPKYFPRQ